MADGGFVIVYLKSEIQKLSPKAMVGDPKSEIENVQLYNCN